MTRVTTTATITGVMTGPKVDGSRARPKLRKKNAANTSRSGSANCSILVRNRVAPSTRPIRKAPIASDTPSSSPMPPKATASAKNRMVNSSSSRVRTRRETTVPPNRASVNIATRKVNEMASCITICQMLVSPPITTETMAR